MTFARLLDANGELARVGFDCASCEKDTELRAARGCGVAPLRSDDPSLGPWIATDLTHAVSEGDMDRKDAPNAAYLRYTWANLGEIWSVLGSFWEWCPAWWSRFYDGDHVPVSEQAISIAAQVRRGFAPLIVGRAGDDGVMRAALQAHVMMDAISNQQQKRELDERMSKTGNKPKR